jgi:hypothetical protein
MNPCSRERRTAPPAISCENCSQHLVGDAGHQAAERGELLRLDQAALRLLQLAQRVLGILLGGLEVELGLAFGDGIGAEYLDRARHLADLVAGVEFGDGLRIAPGDDGRHGAHQAAQRPHDAARGGEADQDRDRDRQHHRDRDAGIEVVERLLEPRIGGLFALPHAA